MSLSHVLRGGGGDSPCCAASCSTANPIFECANSMLLALFALSLSPPRGQLSSLVNFISSLLNLYLISGLPSSRSSGEGGSFLPQKSNSAGSCSSGILRSSMPSGLFRMGGCPGVRGPVEMCLLLRVHVQPEPLRSPVWESRRREVYDVWNCLRMGRRMGMHCTMIVPATSDEYQICDMPLRPVFVS